MIELDQRPSTPETLTSPKVEKTKKEIAEKIKSGRDIKSADFKAHWRADDVKEALWKHHHGKCCYCERKRDMKRESDVEHFRPKARVEEETDHPGYWWLAYDWDNYLLACKNCNQERKKDHFPLLSGGIRAFNAEDDLSGEKPVLIHPIADDPGEFIGFDWQESYGILVKAVALDKEGRGHGTINDLTAINDKEVMKRRAELIRFFEYIVEMVTFARHTNNKDELNKYYNDIKSETAAEKEFAGFRRAYFKAAGLGEYIASDK